MTAISLNSSYGSTPSRGLPINISDQSQKQGTAATKAEATSAGSGAGSEVLVQISDKAKAAASAALSFKDVGMAARAKLDMVKEEAAAKIGGSAFSINLNKVNYSSFSDQELAAMKLNSSGNYSQDEQIQAEAMLNERVRVSLETFRGATNAGDRRGHAMTINALYDKMTPEVRSALNWTPTMMAANNRMLQGDETRFGKLDFAEILLNIHTAQTNGGLNFDT